MDIWERLQNTKKNIVLYGTGDGADRLLDILIERNIPVRAVFASDGFVRERSFRGFRVKTLSECEKEFSDMLILLCFGSGRREVIENVKAISAKHELYAPEIPVCGEGLFDRAFYEQHRAELSAVRAHLADRQSVKCFDSLIEYKLSGDISHLFSCESENKDSECLPKLSGAAYIDLGAYTGDSVLSFAESFRDYKKIIAVEPDPRNYRRLCENTAALKNIRCVNAMAGADCGESFLDSKKGRGARSALSGSAVRRLNIDSLIAEIPACEKLYIKLDIEGAELSALCGAEKLFSHFSPLVKIACYHRREDYFSLPLKLLEYNPDYKIYMRHSAHILSWDTDYYFLP